MARIQTEKDAGKSLLRLTPTPGVTEFRRLMYRLNHEAPDFFELLQSFVKNDGLESINFYVKLVKRWLTEIPSDCMIKSNYLIKEEAMRTVTATEFARKFRSMLDSVEFKHEELVIVRNKHEVARIIPGPTTMTALEAMADIYRTLPEEAASGWLEDSRQVGAALKDDVRDPWAS